MIAVPEWARSADPELVASLASDDIVAEGYVLPAYAAIEIAGSALSASGETPFDALSNREFETAIGPVRFDAKGDLADNPYRLFRFDGTEFVPVDTP